MLKKLLFLILSIFLCVSCELDDIEWKTQLVNVSLSCNQGYDVEGLISQNNKLIQAFNLNESNNYTQIVQLHSQTTYDLSYTINDTLFHKTLNVGSQAQTFSFSIIVDTSVDIIEDEIVVEFE